jgi:hypothetical protein
MAQEAVPGRLYLKFESVDAARKAAPGSSDPSDRVLSMLRLYGMMEMTPVLQAGETRRLKGLHVPDDLERTYEIRYSSGLDPAFVASKLAQLPGVAYAEPHYVMHTQLVPNDPRIGDAGHDYFANHGVFSAWDVTQSSSDIIIAIVDSGTDYTHPDLAGKYWRNPNPGLVATLSPVLSHIANDTIGWNFWNSGPIDNPEQTADPRPNGSDHGTHVAGLAAANTNNGIGIAGTGFNSTYMIVRVGGTEAEPTSIGYGYQGILYAALYGADVINCSFGGITFSAFGQDVVTFANSLGSVIVGAAGNTNSETGFYPASYPEVLSVGAIQSNDIRSTFSTFGYDLDVVARGTSVLSTILGNGYALNSGTSMASPIVAGIAALVRHEFPSWSPDRVRHQIRSSSNNAFYGGNSLNLAFKLGKGKVDASRAVTVPLPGVQIRNVRFLADDDSKLSFGEDGNIRLTLINHGAPTSGSFTLESVALNNNMTVGSGSAIAVGVIQTGDSVQVDIPIFIQENFDFTETPTVRLMMNDSGTTYTDFEIIAFDDFLYDVIDVNRAVTSFATNGTIGYENATAGTGGIGFQPIVETTNGLQQLESLLYEAGLMISLTSERGVFMVNQVRSTNGSDTHFRPKAAFTVNEPGSISDADGVAIFTSEGFPAAPPLEVIQEVYAFSEAAVNRSVFVKYTIRNTSTELIRNVRAGLFADWDIGDYEDNTVSYSAEDSILYAYSPDELDTYPYVTIAHLGPISSALAIDNSYDGVADSVNFGTYFSASSSSQNGYTRQEKLWSLTAETVKTSVSNKDVAMATASGSFMLAPQQEMVVGFVMAFGETLPILRAQIAASRAKRVFEVSTVGFGVSGPPWVDNPTEVALLPNYPNPFNPGTTIRFTNISFSNVKVDVFDMLGRHVAELANRPFGAGEHRIEFDATGLATGAYIVRLTTDGDVVTRIITLLK